MKPLVGWGLGGASFTARDVPSALARIGEPTWGPNALLRDLEMRLGLPTPAESASVRVPRWAARIRALADAKAFYARSFVVDDIGTAGALLEWRDALVEAGWDGAPVPNGGERLEALAAIENHPSDEALPLGRSDRLARVERALASSPGRIYETITLVEARALWSTRLRRVFDASKGRGRASTRSPSISRPRRRRPISAAWRARSGRPSGIAAHNSSEGGATFEAGDATSACERL